MEWAENFKGLQHIGIPTNDMDKTVEFYKKIGFEVAHETKDGDVRVVFLKLRDLILETYENKEAALCDGAVAQTVIPYNSATNPVFMRVSGTL